MLTTIVPIKTKYQEIRDKLCKEREEMGYIHGVLDFYNELVKQNKQDIARLNLTKGVVIEREEDG